MSEATIIVRTKDRPILLNRVLQSILDQTFQYWNIVLINNGGSIDQVNIVVEKYKSVLKDRLTLIHLEKAFGMEVATNIGIKKSQGEFVTLLDDDDTWHPEFLMTCIKALNGNQLLDGVVTQTTLIYEEIVNGTIFEESKKQFNPNLLKVTSWRMSRKNLFTTNSFVYRRIALDDIGLYREDLPVLGDWEFNIRFITKKKIAVIPYPLSFYHKRVSSNDKNYRNSELMEHIRYDKAIRADFFYKSIQQGTPLLGLAIFTFGYINRSIRLLKTAFHFITND